MLKPKLLAQKGYFLFFENRIIEMQNLYVLGFTTYFLRAKTVFSGL